MLTDFEMLDDDIQDQVEAFVVSLTATFTASGLSKAAISEAMTVILNHIDDSFK